MKPVVVMQVEGVLRKPTGAVLDSGRRLYAGLAGFFRIVLVTEETDREFMTGWLGMEGFSKHDHIIYELEPALPRAWLDTANVLRNSYGYPIEYVVLTDPAAARALIERGYSTLLMTNAAYAFPEWRPDTDKGVTPWAELEAEISAQRQLRAQDKRMEDDLR